MAGGKVAHFADPSRPSLKNIPCLQCVWSQCCLCYILYLHSPAKLCIHVTWWYLPFFRSARLIDQSGRQKEKYAACYKSNAGCPSHDAMVRTFAGRKSATARKTKKKNRSDLRKVYIENAGTTLDSTLRKIHFPKLIVKTYSSKSSGTISFRSSPRRYAFGAKKSKLHPHWRAMKRPCKFDASLVAPCFQSCHLHVCIHVSNK